MDKNLMNISKIETYLNDVFGSEISEHTFFTTAPGKESIDPSWEDMVLIEIPNGVDDLEAYGRGTVLVWLYARPLSNGRKNVAVISNLEQRLNDVIANASDEHYFLSRRQTYTDYDTSVDWHCNAVEVILKVF